MLPFKIFKCSVKGHSTTSIPLSLLNYSYCCCWAIKHGRGRNDSVSARHIFYSTDSLSCSWRSRTPTTSVISSSPILPTSTYTSLLSHSPFFHHPQEAWVREIKTFHQMDGRKGELEQPTLSKSWHVSPYSLATVREDRRKTARTFWERRIYQGIVLSSCSNTNIKSTTQILTHFPCFSRLNTHLRGKNSESVHLNSDCSVGFKLQMGPPERLHSQWKHSC